MRLNRLEVLVLSAIILLGLIHLPYPFHGDQALFTIGALKISDGAVLYRDFWDLKQPGIYGFYLLAGSLFGFDEVGIHMFELLYMALFSLVLMKTLKAYYRNPSMAGLVPLLTVGIYYGVSGQWHLTQLEALVGFPMFLSLWYGTGYSYPKERQSFRFFLSGVMGEIVLLFKFMFLPIVAAFWLATLIDATLCKREAFFSTLIRIGVPIVLGMAAPLLIVVGYFASNNTVGLLYWTFFEYPAQLMRDPPYTNPVIHGLRWLISQFAPLIALAFIGAFISLTNPRDRLLTLNFLLWSVVGLLVILLQSFSRWEYHYLLLFVPLGILSVKALDILWEQMKAFGPPVNSWGGRMAVIVGLVLLFSPVLNLLAKKSLDLARHGFALTREQRLQYHRSSSSAYLEALAEVRFLSEPGSLPGDIYIIGDPTYYLLSGRHQAIALNGYGTRLWLPSQSMRLTEQLSQACPPYIFNALGNLISERSPGTARFIEENYHVLRRSNQGVWYVLKRNGDPLLEPLRIGETIAFSSEGNGANYLLQGWSSPEEWGVWSDGNKAGIGFRPQFRERKAGDLLLTIESQAFVSPKHPHLAIEVFANGSKLGEWQLAFGIEAGELVARVPRALVPENGNLRITFVINNPVSPKELGISDDSRRLGVGVRKMSLVWAGNETRHPSGSNQ